MQQFECVIYLLDTWLSFISIRRFFFHIFFLFLQIMGLAIKW